MSTPRPLVVKVDATHHTSDVYSENFISAGFQVVRAMSVKEGIKLARRCKPDLIVTLDDPKHGIDAAEWLRVQHSDTEARLAMTPLIILAANRNLDRLRIHELPDRVRVLQRALDFNSLLSHVRQMLARWDF